MASKRTIRTQQHRVDVLKRLDAGHSCRAVAIELGSVQIEHVVIHVIGQDRCLPIFITLTRHMVCVCISSFVHDMCNRRVPVDMCVKMSIPATRDHLPRGDTLAPNRQCPLVAGTTVDTFVHCIII